MAFVFTVTIAGRAALRNASGDGTSAVRIATVGLTATAFTSGQPLPNEIKRVSTIKGGATAADTIHVTVSDAGADVYTVRGFGLYLTDGTLFASYGQTGVIVEKSAQSIMQLAADIQFLEVTADQIIFGDTNFNNPAATVDMLGVVKLASDTDAVAGTDNVRAVTPRALLAALNDRLGTGAPTTFFKSLLLKPSVSALCTALGIRGAAQYDPGHGNGLDADLLDGKEGAFYLDYRNMTNAPSPLIPGQIIVFAGIATPVGTLPCDGKAYSRSAYPALFNAIGTIYGNGDGSTTFNVPGFKEGTAIKVTTDAKKVGTYSAGTVLSHTHGTATSTVADHRHTPTMGGAGTHSHSASSSGEGNHAHDAWTDVQGWHGHDGWTNEAGQHQHLTHNIPAGGAVGGAGGSPTPNRIDVWTDAAGNHNHYFGTSGAGNHGHNIGMNGAGWHVHTISIGGVGDHAHSLDIAAAGGHSHTVNVLESGATDNLPAGVFLMHYIAY
jgi:microcystin-dependent protein